MTESLAARDVRALFRLLGELRELGADPRAWRAHLATNLEALCDAGVVVVSELQQRPDVPSDVVTCADVVTPLQAVEQGLDVGLRERFYRDLYFTDHTIDDALEKIVPLYGSAFTVARSDVVRDAHWNRSLMANERFRPLGCDDFILSMVPVYPFGVICGLDLYRAPGKRFTARERLIVSLLHEELANDWSRATKTPSKQLTPRQREVLGHLAEGASEKEIAADLGLSPHTTHDHVKAIYRAFGVRSRGELLAHVGHLAREQPARTRLVVESL